MKKKPVLDYIWKRAEELVPAKRAGHWKCVIRYSTDLVREMSDAFLCWDSQALMDLGATVCTPKNPKCAECPLNKACLAYAEVCSIARSTC